MPEERKLKGDEAGKASIEAATVETDESYAPGEKTNNPHDKGYKRVLKNRRVLLHMLRKYTDFDWVRDVREEDIDGAVQRKRELDGTASIPGLSAGWCNVWGIRGELRVRPDRCASVSEGSDPEQQHSD